MLYRYVKARVRYTSAPAVVLPNRFARFLPTFLLVVGLFLISSAAAPISYYQFFISPNFGREMVKPVADDFLTVKAQKQEVLGEQANLDMSKASNWFPSAPRLEIRPSKITSYSLSIPKLKIKDATVIIGGEDLMKSLIHYSGTALPGQFGSTVVFGHSTLPQFSSPDDYKSIFTTLPKLKKGDVILVYFDGVNYRYVVEEMVEVKPDDISVLEQRYDDSYITLITCVPPGTYLRRLVVRARLTPR
ncbi:MAG: sortase [bacterium]|nr:sortase [bacterium]